jgi:uncharacterized membrane-anchored protein
VARYLSPPDSYSFNVPCQRADTLTLRTGALMSSQPSIVRLGSLVVFALLSSAAARAQQSEESPLAKIPWTHGPIVGKLGDIAEVKVPANCRFTDADGAKQFMEATQNPPSGTEQGVLLCRGTVASDSSFWFVVFEYNASGLVRDDDKSKLDQVALLRRIQRGTEAGNEERRKRGWGEIEVVGWQRAPYYDSLTHNLTWATRLRDKGPAGEETINHSVRLLGRGGVMNVDLVADPSQAESAVTAFDSILTDYAFIPGQRYSEWRAGDKVAEYGLTALIAGGAGAAAVKLGLFGKLWKAILMVVLALKKLVIIVVVAIGGFFKKLFGKRKSEPAAAPPPRA